ncbi:hypothetical protein ACIGXM_24275 [Kitasatospora sp. NPDC052896]|uniref:SCO2583 family membrane protein n=1 Tax=Kitasatospora sp. NPDC052896 TaxID=3364061 RepID=UPI0037CAA6BB
MGDPGEPPEGVPEGGSGSDDEYRSVVFDESFVRAARITELSAQERLGGGFSHPVRRRLGPLTSLPRQALTLLLLIVVAFAAAVYFGVSAPRRDAGLAAGTQLTTGITALAPASSTVPAVSGPDPFGSLSPAAGYADGAAGLGLPAPTATAHFSKAQVGRALAVVRRYLEASALSPAVLVQGDTSPVRVLLAPAATGQFDDSLATPTDDQHHEPTGWLVRFDPARVALASDNVKVAGKVTVTEADAATLEITTDHTMVYALRPAGTAVSGPVSLYSVRRELHFYLDGTDVAAGQLQPVDAVLQAGPTACGSVQTSYLQPLLAGPAGPAAGAPGAVNPGDRSQPAWQRCSVLAPGF